MRLQTGIEALRCLDSDYVKQIKFLLKSNMVDKQARITRLSAVREGIKQSIRVLRKVKDKNVEVVNLNRSLV